MAGMEVIPESTSPLTPVLVSSNSFRAVTRSVMAEDIAMLLVINVMHMCSYLIHIYGNISFRFDYICQSYLVEFLRLWHWCL